MGWGRYWLPSQNREGGYLIEAECDAEGCSTRIDRGLDYLCGTMPESTSEDGCGLYHCSLHGPPAAHACEWEYQTPCECDSTRPNAARRDSR